MIRTISITAEDTGADGEKTKRAARHKIKRSGWAHVAALYLIAGLSIASTARNHTGERSSMDENRVRSAGVERFLVRVLIPVKRLQTETSEPKQLVDSLFPNWQEVAVAENPEHDDLMISLQLDGRMSPDTFLLGSLWGFRKKPYDIKPLGMAAPQSTGTETSLTIKGSASLVRRDKQIYLQAEYEFPNPEVAGKWLTEFPQGTKIFEAGFHLRKNLTEEQNTRMKNFWREVFGPAGKLRIEISGTKNFVLEYDLQKTNDALMIEDGWIKIPYTLGSKSKLVSGTL